jgi:hypothetical protein
MVPGGEVTRLLGPYRSAVAHSQVRTARTRRLSPLAAGRPSLAKPLATWVSTVLGLRKSCWPMRQLDRPSAMCRNTAHSLSLNWSSPGALMAARGLGSTSVPTLDGLVATDGLGVSA